MYKRILNKVLIGLFAAFILFISFSVSSDVAAKTILEEKVYCEATLDDDFSDNRVLLVLNKSCSYSNNVYDENTFSNYDCNNVTELTYMITSSLKTKSNNSLINTDNYNRVLCLELSDNSKSNVLNIINDLIQREDVIYAGPDYKITIDSTSSNDSFFDNQWAVDSIKLADAWDYTKGTNDVLVGVMDTGIDGNHPDLANSIVNNLCRDFTSGTEIVQTNPIDPNGHGTHVAGTIGAIGNNNIGVTGVNWNIGLVSLRVFDEYGSGYSSSVANAINFAIQNDIPILNLSAKWTNNDFTYDYALENVIDDYNGLLICASGNDNKNNDGNNPALPASINLPNIISVGSHDSANNRSLFSNYGEISVDLYAPGENILSTFPDDICNERNHIFDDGTRLCEISNYYYELFLIIMRINDYTFDELEDHLGEYWSKTDGSAFVPKEFASSSHLQNGYHFMSGTSMATPYVTGVAALLLSLNEELTTAQLKQAILESAEEITITVPDTSEGAEEDDTVEQGVLKLNAYNAVKYVLENYMNPITYTLSNYSSTVNTNKEITSDASYFDELNGFYKLDVTYAKNYEFISLSTSGIEVILYDTNFNEIPYDNLDATSNKVHFIKNLSIGTYYLRTKYTDEENFGIINTKIVSRNTAYLGYGVINNILINTYNNNSAYIFPNSYGEGLYKFTLEATLANGLSVTYPAGSLKIYSDSDRTNLLNRYNNFEENILALSQSNENVMFAYLPSNGHYYLDISLPSNNYSSARIKIEKAESSNIDYTTRLSSIGFDVLFEYNSAYSNFEEVSISHRSLIQLDILTNESISQNVKVIVLQKLKEPGYEPGDNHYYNVVKFEGYITSTNRSPVFDIIFDKGTYYIGFISNNNHISINVSLRRLVNQEVDMDNTLVADPAIDEGFTLGSEVIVNNGLCNNDTITEGFTRCIYLMVENRFTDPISRLEYDWYSGNDNVAIVTAYGTVIAQSVNVDTEVTIYAVSKNDPSIVYRKTFTVLNDLKTYETDPLDYYLTMTVEVRENKLINLSSLNVPIDMTQYYNWSGSPLLNINYWGYIYADSSTQGMTFEVIGNYRLNSRVRIHITVYVN